MSISAYRIVKIKKAETSSFNLGYDEKLVQFLDKGGLFYAGLGSQGVGLVDVPVKILENALEKAEELELSEDTVQNIREDIAAAKREKDCSVTYYCF